MSMLSDLIEGAEPTDEWGVADRRDKPALLTLLHDQAALLDASFTDDHEVAGDLRSGFHSRRDLIEWYQRAAVRTFGYIADDWAPMDCLNDETLRSALITDPCGDLDPMGAKAAGKYRSLIEATVVQPACNRAYRDLRKVARTYIKTPDTSTDVVTPGNQDLDPGEQKHIAMRPGFRNLDRQQAEAIDRLWGGFTSRDALLDWLHGLNSPSNGEIDPDLAGKVLADETAMEYLLYRPFSSKAYTYQQLFAVTTLLPAFIEGIDRVDTDELAKKRSEGSTTLRMKGGVEYE